MFRGLLNNLLISVPITYFAKLTALFSCCMHYFTPSTNGRIFDLPYTVFVHAHHILSFTTGCLMANSVSFSKLLFQSVEEQAVFMFAH